MADIEEMQIGGVYKPRGQMRGVAQMTKCSHGLSTAPYTNVIYVIKHLTTPETRSEPG